MSFRAVPLTLLTLCAPAGAQASVADLPPPEERASCAAQAIRDWVTDYARGRLGPHGTLRGGARLQPEYAKAARRGGFVRPIEPDNVTHLDMLQKLLFHAETNPTTELADAVLSVCAAGLEGSFLDQDALQLREVGHWTLMRMDHQGAWFLVLRAASGDRVPLLGDLRTEDQGREGLAEGPARRVAALRLLGNKALPVFRSTIEGALGDPDPRVRFAAAEALEMQRRPDSLPRVLDSIRVERHPVVTQALARLLLGVLQAAGEELSRERRDAAIDAALAQLGCCGWRTDMELLDLVEAFPHKAAIPLLIELLARKAKRDLLVDTVNSQASPRLRSRTVMLLRGMAGALIGDDADAWRAFWNAEQDHIVVPAQLPHDRPEATRGQFFGVAVTGGSVAFVIDTSGSMDEEFAGTSAGGRSGRRHTRLQAAKEQIVAAVQAMPEESRYTLITFAGHARVWNGTPQKPGRNSVRNLTELLSRLRAYGGTNLFDGIATAMQMDGQRYGEEVASKIDEVFVLSDGEPTEGDVQDTETLLRIVREANKYASVRIHTVFTGTGPGAELLRRLAEENDGVFVQR
jgi:hypothetical protein